jgi:hypothetical protein
MACSCPMAEMMVIINWRRLVAEGERGRGKGGE